jgi:hypothetical protein
MAEIALTASLTRLGKPVLRPPRPFQFSRYLLVLVEERPQGSGP